MQVLRLNEVLMRVVAWHNRHPLARRITAAQVHSIGEVLLPFAASVPALMPPMPHPRSSLPGVDELLQTPQAAVPMWADDPGSTDPVWAHDTGHATADAVPDAAATVTTAADTDNLPPDRHAEAPPATDAEPGTQTEASPFTLAEADLAARLAAELNDAAHAPTAAAAEAPDIVLPLEPQAAPHPPATPPNPAPGATPPSNATVTPPSRLKRLLARLTGRQPGVPRLQSTFSRDFIWPISPRQVARWARAHGQLQPLAPADWPRRVVETDDKLLGTARQNGLAHSVELHVLTAAIGVGDRRLRVLMDARGAVIGPRAYSRPRLAAVGGLLAMAMLGVGWSTLRPKLPDGSVVLAAATAASAPAAAAPLGADSTAAVTVRVEPAASAASSAVMAVAAASVPADGTRRTQHADAAVAARTDATVPAKHPADSRIAGPATAGQPAAAAPAATPTTHAAVPAAAGQSGSLGRIRPSLSDEDKQAARAQTATLRSNKAAAPRAVAVATAQVTVYAVVSRPSPQREVASAGLAVMRRASGRLPEPVPDHSELMQNQGAWRAAWWPFASLADAERARVLLAGKGLKVDVVEF